VLLSRLLTLCVVALTIATSGCTNIGGASKSSTSLTSFLGFSELPDWYISSRYTYPDSQYRDNDFATPIHYRDVGEGDVIVLVHGELSSLHAWDKWVEILRQEFRVIAIDLPGSGITGAPRCIDNTKERCPDYLSEDYLFHTLTYLIEDLQLSNIHLVGASYGGYLTSKYALENPSRVSTLTLISPMGMQQEAPFMIDYLDNSSLISSYVQPASVITTIVDDMYGNPDRITQASLKRSIHLLQAQGAHETNVIQAKLLSKLMQHGTEDSMSDIESRSLVMWGTADKWGNTEHAQRWTEDIPNAVLVEYKGVGHLSMEERPEDSAYDLIAFINDEPLPTLEGLGRDSFTLQEAVDSVGDKESLFGDNLEQMQDEE